MMSNDRAAPNQYEPWLVQLLRRLFELAKFNVSEVFKIMAVKQETINRYVEALGIRTNIYVCFVWAHTMHSAPHLSELSIRAESKAVHRET